MISRPPGPLRRAPNRAGLVALVLTDFLRVGLSWGPSGEPTLWETWPEVAVVGFLVGVAAVVAAGRHLAYLTSEAARHRRALTGSGEG
ncbi:hypothetical protein [Pseudonocardia aurantiaca]|uniref:hypothetical protein n=1 Tax=Pseudonocardia aurantiaca TaxID=75290 RepID=UPI0031D604BB